MLLSVAVIVSWHFTARHCEHKHPSGESQRDGRNAESVDRLLAILRTQLKTLSIHYIQQ